MLGTLAVLGGGGLAASYGASSGTAQSVSALFQWFCTIFLPLTIGTLVADHTKNKDQSKQLQVRKHSLHEIAQKHNAVTDMLEQSYRMEKSTLGLFDKQAKERLRKQYERKYLQNKQSFNQEIDQLLAAPKHETATTRAFKKFWKMLIAVGMTCQLAACCYIVGTLSALQPEQPQATTSYDGTQEAIRWNAENIPMPHLTDGSRYVSNPDGVVSTHTEQLLNQWLKRMDDSLQIESAMVIVNRVENGDPFRVAQDIFDRYKVGKNDRGLVIVLAYQDHKVRTHTGRSLEADLTDIECSRLQETYAIPFMKAEQPDSGMLYLTEAIYNTLKGKDLPITQSQKIASEAETVEGIFDLFLLLFGAWAILIGYLYYRYNGLSGRSLLRANPFAQAPVVIVGGGGGRSGGFGGGGGSFGGGFSGGSSGGGGATSSW